MTPNYCPIRCYYLCWVWSAPKTMYTAFFHIVFRWGGLQNGLTSLTWNKMHEPLWDSYFPQWLLYLSLALVFHLWVLLPTMTRGAGHWTARLWALLQMSLLRGPNAQKSHNWCYGWWVGSSSWSTLQIRSTRNGDDGRALLRGMWWLNVGAQILWGSPDTQGSQKHLWWRHTVRKLTKQQRNVFWIHGEMKRWRTLREAS